MLVDHWQLGLVLAVIAVHALVTYRTLRLSRRSSPDPAGDAPVDRDAGTVSCPSCGAENDLGYRYCRSCVGELPASMEFGGAPAGPLGRMTR